MDCVQADDRVARAGAHCRRSVELDFIQPPATPCAFKKPALLSHADTATNEKSLAALRGILGITAAGERVLVTPLERITIRDGLLKHLIEDKGRVRHAPLILPTLQQPDEIWLALYDTGEHRKHYIKVWGGGKNTFAIITEAEDGGLFYNFMPHRDINSRRVGKLLYFRPDSEWKGGKK